jgi:hypothetical protein
MSAEAVWSLVLTTILAGLLIGSVMHSHRVIEGAAACIEQSATR